MRTDHLPKVARSFLRLPTDATDPSVVMSSHMCVYGTNSNAQHALSMDWFVESAVGYRLSGEPTRSLCEHNASVASRLSRSEVAQTWRMLQLMCATSASASHVAPAQPSSVCSLQSTLQLTEPGACVLSEINTSLCTMSFFRNKQCILLLCVIYIELTELLSLSFGFSSLGLYVLY